MKAYRLHDIGDIRLEETGKPVPGFGEVLVAVRAAGICGSDIPRIYRTGAHVHPLIPGHEFAGEVVETGGGARSWMGKRVGVFPLIPCKACGPCQNGQYEMCRHYGYLGSRQDGGFAEYVAVPKDNLLALPDSVSFEQAAMLEPMAVAVHAMRQALGKVSGTEGAGQKAAFAGKKAVVCGLGTIGFFMLLFLREAGLSHILAVGNKDFQKETFRKLGFLEESFCDSRKEDVGKWLAAHTDEKGADLFFECVGKNETFLWAAAHTAPAGNVVLVGNPHSDMTLPRDVYWKILRNQLHVTGTWNSSFTHDPGDDWHYVLQRLAHKKLDPVTLITHRFSLEDLARGFLLMRDKTEEYGKVMMV